MLRLRFVALAALLPLGGCVSIQYTSSKDVDAMPTPDVDMRVQESGVVSSLRGVYAVDENTCWASGSAGTCLRTTDAGKTWERLVVPNAEEIDFRDVHPFDENNALLLTAGTPARIYRTSDGGAYWTIMHEDHREGAFFDGMDFWDESRGVIFGDPIDGVFTILLTEDGGRTWREVEKENIAPAMPGEAGFAASGTCVATGADGHAAIALGGDTGFGSARLLLSDDYGASWDALTTTKPTSASAGLFSVAFFDGTKHISVGGDYANPNYEGEGQLIAQSMLGQPRYSEYPGDNYLDTVFHPTPMPYRSCVAVGELDGEPVFLASGAYVNTVSSHLTGYLWREIDPIPGAAREGSGPSIWYQHAVSFAPGTSRAWAVGAEGKITRIDLSVPVESGD